MPTRAAGRAGRRARPGSVLPASFYDRDTGHVARELLGATLRCESAEGVASGRIVETEAYLGPHDPACHAVAGVTRRTRDLHGAPGTAYVYFIYGVHWCFNAVTMPEGHGSAVLVRALEPLDGIALMRTRRPRARRDNDLTNGPGKLCAALGITGAHSGLSLQDSAVTIVAGQPLPDADVLVSPRIGISQAADWPLRWLVRDSAFTSKTPSHHSPRSLCV